MLFKKSLICQALASVTVRRAALSVEAEGAVEKEQVRGDLVRGDPTVSAVPVAQARVVDPMDLFGPVPTNPVPTGRGSPMVTGGNPTVWTDPFSPPPAYQAVAPDPLLPPSHNPAVVPSELGHERNLVLTEAVVDLTQGRMEQAMEEECVAEEHRREETSYEREQAEVLAEEKGKTVTRKEDEAALEGPVHTCDRVWRTHEMILPQYFRPLEEDWETAKRRCFNQNGSRKYGQDCKSARLPTFPERLGEFVIQDVVHKEPEAGKHVKLTLRSCTSCPNDGTATVDWGGLSTVNEQGEYHGGSRSMAGRVGSTLGSALGFESLASGGGEEVVEVRESYKCLGGRFTGLKKATSYGNGTAQSLRPSSCRHDPQWNAWTSPTPYIATEALQAGLVPSGDGDAPVPALPVGVTRATYGFSSKKGDTIVKAELAAMDEATLAHDSAGKLKAQTDLIHSLEAESKRVPFNHKAEQVHIALQVCTDQPDGSLHCEEAVEQLVLHDQALVGASAGQHLTLNEIGDADLCTVGACGPSGLLPGSRGRGAGPKTVCERECTTAARGRSNPLAKQSGICRASAVNLDPRYQKPADGRFSCIQEQVKPAGPASPWTDILVQHDIPMRKESGAIEQVPVATGLFFREGSQSKAHVTGGIQWHVTVPAVGGCTPVLQDALYIGMGVDEADVCPGGGADLDVGITLFSCAEGGFSKGAGLGGASGHSCRVVDHASWYNRNSYSSKHWVAFSGDNQSGEGEGDDEWMFLRLDGLKKKRGVTHIAVTAHVFGCVGSPDVDVKFGDLEGAFVRIVAGEADRHNFKASATIGYIDLDAQFAKTDKYGGLVGVVFLEDDGPKKHGEPSSLNLVKPPYEEAAVASPLPHRHDAVASEHKHFQLVAMDFPLANGKVLVDACSNRGRGIFPCRNKGGGGGETRIPYTGAMDAVMAAVFEGRELDESDQVAHATALMKEEIGHGERAPLQPQVGSPGEPEYRPPAYDTEGAIHNYLVEQEPENLAYQYAHHGSETSEEAKARKRFGANVNTEEFLDKFTMAMGAGVPGASTYCVAPSWIRQKSASMRDN